MARTRYYMNDRHGQLKSPGFVPEFAPEYVKG